MKIGSLIAAGIGAIVLAVAVGILAQEGQETSDNTLRVAFFPNIGHAIPIVGLERGTFEENFGNSTSIEPKLFDSGPQVIESLFANSIDYSKVFID